MSVRFGFQQKERERKERQRSERKAREREETERYEMEKSVRQRVESGDLKDTVASRVRQMLETTKVEERIQQRTNELIVAKREEELRAIEKARTECIAAARRKEEERLSEAQRLKDILEENKRKVDDEARRRAEGETRAMLERQAFEERFQSDVLLGDLTWETSYGLPGEGNPPRVRADLTLEWPTWSQTAYRSWYIEEDLPELPRIDIEVVLRIQRLAAPPDARKVLQALSPESPAIGGERLRRSGPTVEAVSNEDLTETEHAIEVTYEGSYELDETTEMLLRARFATYIREHEKA